MSIQHQLSQSASLLSAVEAVRNWRAAVVMLGSLVLTGLLFGLGALVSFQVHPALGAVFVLLALAVSFYGAIAAGTMLMDEARGGRSRPMIAAVLTALTTGHRLILVMLMVGLVYFAGLLAILLLLFICKIPGVGPLLFAFVFPACVVLSGVAIFALYAVIMPLAAPAIFSGATAMQALSQLAAMARQRLLSVVLSMLVLMLIVMIVAGVLGGVMLTGTLLTGGLAASILNVGGMMNVGHMTDWLSLGGGSGSGYMAGGAFGGAIVWAIALTLPALVYCRGCCQVYLANVQLVNAQDMEQQLRGSLDAARRKAEEIKARGEAMAAQHVRPVLAAPVAPVSQQCPACSAPVFPGDVFCGGCGHKLN